MKVTLIVMKFLNKMSKSKSMRKNNNFSENQALLLVTGICGGFTTFSAFAYENQQFLKDGDLTSFAIYSLGSLTLGILAVFLGLFVSKSF